MNFLSATSHRTPSSPLEVMAAQVAHQLSGIWRDRIWLTVITKARAATVLNGYASDTASADRTHGNEVSSRPGSIGAGNMYGRFQRDIVPHLDAAYNFARFLSRNPDAAQDIVQEAFLRAYRNFDGYQGGDARAWIFAIVRNCYQNWLMDRRRKARLEVDIHGQGESGDFSVDDVPSDDDTPETALLRTGEANAVRTVLNKLPRPLREVLVLRELEGLSYRQISETAALPIGTVMSRLARARAQFGSVWREESSLREIRS
jgi:RNA polymerase sigma-70 factor (ECF subfamily)